MSISRKVEEGVIASSWAVRMFEDQSKTSQVKEICDFRLGNPEIEPPAGFTETLKAVVQNSSPGMHRYTPLAGYTETREAVARALSKESGLPFHTKHIIMTAGATGALNIIFKAILNPGEEVIILAPHFVEYPYYIDNHGGVCTVVETNSDFTINIDTLAAKITPNTRAILINNPNNPSGQVYTGENIKAVAELLSEKSQKFGRDIFLISDEAYKFITYDNVTLPNISKIYPNTFIAASYSKQLSIPGERIGYAAANPGIKDIHEVIEALTFANRILGYLSAPALMQRVITHLQETSIDITEYTERRNIFCNALEDFGYSFTRPKGTYYIFPKSPTDDLVFTQELAKEGILVNPGRNFRRKGYFRIAFCVKKETIEKSLQGFKRVKDRFRSAE
ncbi:MAG: pyridoxal phosphate-dependent aminotransferase [wastewater metagenome]|nr:pyridoxal phosphate-dependent aminotransferase [Candidatus Loosdrechtia aerotolerans]